MSRIMRIENAMPEKLNKLYSVCGAMSLCGQLLPEVEELKAMDEKQLKNTRDSLFATIRLIYNEISDGAISIIKYTEKFEKEHKKGYFERFPDSRNLNEALCQYTYGNVSLKMAHDKRLNDYTDALWYCTAILQFSHFCEIFSDWARDHLTLAD